MPPKSRGASPTKESQRPPSLDTEQSSSMRTASPVFPQASGATPVQGGRRATGRGSMSGSLMMGDGISKEELIQKHLEMQERYEQLQPINAKLVKDVKKKKESYVRREVFYKSQISHIKEMLEKTVLCRGSHESSIPSIRNMQSEIMGNLDEMQIRRARAVEEHEKNLLRQFRSNIIEVEDRLKKEQSKEDDVAGVPRAWIERTAQLSKDVDKHKEQAMRLDRINDVLNQKLEKYKHECKIQEDDREFLVRQLVAIKKENSRLRREIDKITSGAKIEALRAKQSEPRTTSRTGKVGQLRESVMSASGLRPGTISSAGNSKIDSRAELQRYSEVYERLKKLLDTERRHTRDAKATHMRLITNRTELEGMLRDCVDEMKEEAGISIKDADREPGGHGLSKEDRERVLELLLSQEKAIAHLYGDTFRTSAPSVTTMAVNAPGPDIKSRREETDLSVYVNDLAGVDDSDDDDR